MKKTEAALEDDKVAVEAMQSRAIDDSDVDEDCEVADLTSIPTPKIGFKLPNLGQPKPSAEKVKKPKKGQALTAELLNNEIVKMRESVSKAQRFAASKLARDVKSLRAKLEKKPDDKASKKIARLEEDQKLIHTLAKDEVAKFALLNKKSRGALSFSADTPSTERCLYYLATEKPVAKAVEGFRKRYEDWEVRTAYFLQRLGLQYQGLKAEREAASKVGKPEEEAKDVVAEKPKVAKEENEQEKAAAAEEENDALENEEKEPEDDVSDGEEEGDSASDVDNDELISDVEMGSGSEDAETTENRRKMLFDLCGIKEDKARPMLAPKPKKIEEEEQETEEGSKPEALSSSKDDSKAALKKIIQKKLRAEAPKSAKDIKQLKSTLKEEQKQEKGHKRLQVEPAGSSSTVVKKVKLSEGGVIQVEKFTAATEKEEKEDESVEDSDTAPVSSFFLSADGVSSRNDNDSSGEESVDDDEDMAVTPLPKKGGQMRQMSSARAKLQSKLESRQFETKKKLQSHKKEFIVGRKETTKKPDPSAPETLHPSWAARVEKKKQMENVKPQGKRMVFADDD